MLIRNVEINRDLQAVRLAKGKILAMGTDLYPREGEEIYDGQGGALIPALHDHHIHLNATAAAWNSVRLDTSGVQDRAGFIRTLTETKTYWVRAVGYHERMAGAIDRIFLDSVLPHRPVRVQHRSGRLWILNSAAMAELGLTEPVDGRLFDGDALLREQAGLPDLRPLMMQLLAWGVGGVTEVTPHNDRTLFTHYQSQSHGLRLSIMGGMELNGLESPELGALKLHYHDHDLPALDVLIAEIAAAHAAGRAVAAHCVTRAELWLTLAALEAAGVRAGDRIEHAAVADMSAVEAMSCLNVSVVTQPRFITERAAAYRQDVELCDRPHLWPLRRFLDAGLNVAISSDAPFASANPWQVMAAAVNRPEDFSPQEAITPEQALALYTRPANAVATPSRRIEVGAPADMCLLDRSWVLARQDVSKVSVRATWVQGCKLYDAV